MSKWKHVTLNNDSTENINRIGKKISRSHRDINILRMNQAIRNYLSIFYNHKDPYYIVIVYNNI